jgi:putative ABC transport system permease protein
MPNTSRADELAPGEKEHDWSALDGDYGYLKLAPGVAPATVLAKLNRLFDQAFDPRTFGVNLRASEFEQHRLTPFKDAHLTSDRYGAMQPAGSWTTVYGVIGIAVLILLVASFNFMNLATARATLRAREIALRKLGGATRAQLIGQFLGEAVLMALLSLVVALALVEVLLPVYARLLEKPLQFHYGADVGLLAALAGLAVLVGLLSGLYPATVLAAFRPALTLKAGSALQRGGGRLRAALVVIQFAISIGLGITALVVFTQIDFARRVDLGFRQDGVVIVRGIARLTPALRASFAHALRANPEITGVEYSNGVPLDLFNTSNPLIQAPGAPQGVTAHLINIGPEFPSLYDMRLLAGRLLSDARGEDESAPHQGRNMLVNAAAARALGFTPEEALGKTFKIGGDFGTARIVGVLAAANLAGLTELPQPAVYYFDPAGSHAMTLMSIRLRGDRIPEALAFIDKAWRVFVPGAAIDRYFLSDAFLRQFQADERQGRMLVACVTVAIFIACLGLFGLAVFTAERRSKEIGVRKISGARTVDVIWHLLKQISIPVLLANVIAWPVAYYYLNRWLEEYAYRVRVQPLYFVAAGAAALVIAWATVFVHAVRLARASPVHALRYE